MKSSLSFLFILLLLNVNGQGALKQAQSLIEAGKYLSAFEVLNTADPEHQSEAILIKQSNLILDYYAHTDQFQRFALKDLAENESLAELRKSAQDFEYLDLRIDSLLFKKLEQTPEALKLHLALGRYYFELYQTFGKESYMPESMVLARMEMHFALAYKRGVKDEYSTYALGLKKLLDRAPVDAIPFLEDHLKFAPAHADAHYNLAYAYDQAQRKMKSIEHARMAIEFYEEPSLKADAARMVALSYAQLNDTLRSLEFFRLADQIEPDNYYTLKYLLQTEILVDTVAFQISRARFFRLGPDKNSIYQDLYRLHLGQNKEAELLAYYGEELANYESDTLVMANLYLHRAILWKDLNDIPASLEEVKLAEAAYKKVYPPNHKVFTFIRSYFKPLPKN